MKKRKVSSRCPGGSAGETAVLHGVVHAYAIIVAAGARIVVAAVAMENGNLPQLKVAWALFWAEKDEEICIELHGEYQASLAAVGRVDKTLYRTVQAECSWNMKLTNTLNMTRFEQPRGGFGVFRMCDRRSGGGWGCCLRWQRSRLRHECVENHREQPRRDCTHIFAASDRGHGSYYLTRDTSFEGRRRRYDWTQHLHIQTINGRFQVTMTNKHGS